VTHILVIGKVWPEPASSAAGKRMMQLISAFKEQGDKISFASPASPTAFSEDLKDLEIDSYSLPINSDEADELLKKLDPGIVIFDRFTTEEQFGWKVTEHCPAALKILDTEDLHFLRDARQRALKENKSLTYEYLCSDHCFRELAAIYRCDMTLIISEAEIDILNETLQVPMQLLHYVPLFAESENNLASFSQTKDFICIGNFLHAPNKDAVLHLQSKIWPLVKKKMVAAKINVYGAYPDKLIMSLHDPKKGFFVHGRTDNAHEVISASRVMLAPLRFGAGLKGKLLEAMSWGTPFVTTPVGAEGMFADLEPPGFVCDNDEQFADEAVKLYEDENLWNSKVRAGSEIIAKRFSASTHIPILMSHVDELRNNLRQHRQKNFTGRMLMYHGHQSTKYMSLWIETKNKIQNNSD
jgi:glycosyltransferase involved in cell wall biosynthesis